VETRSKLLERRWPRLKRVTKESSNSGIDDSFKS
jgi:hypothetical protein